MSLIVPQQEVIPFRGEIVRDPNGVLRVAGMLTVAEYAELERIRMSKFFLVRNDGGDMGEPAPCRHSKSDFDPGHKHPYFTLMCCEQPFRGLEQGLRIWLQAANPQSDRRSAILRQWSLGMRDYAEANPQTGGAVKPMTPDTMAWYARLAGISIPISEARARKLAEIINSRRPPKPFVL
jgi:hypothetical protein